jgi:catechol 2,3-dioxygenase-like lactoylglutathione lyase family enzyme
MRGVIHHVDLTVKDAKASHAFYESVLGFMGYTLQEQTEAGYDFGLNAPGAPYTSIGILDARGPNAARAHDRYTVGLHHLAWTAESRADVDALHQHLLKIGAHVLYAPGEYREYGPTYYAVFFSDPDGLKLEYVHKP